MCSSDWKFPEFFKTHPHTCSMYMDRHFQIILNQFRGNKRNVQGTDITSEKNVQGTDITNERNVKEQTLQAQIVYCTSVHKTSLLYRCLIKPVYSTFVLNKFNGKVNI